VKPKAKPKAAPKANVVPGMAPAKATNGGFKGYVLSISVHNIIDLSTVAGPTQGPPQRGTLFVSSA